MPEISEKKLSPVLENYLRIIFIEENRHGTARAADIACAAGVSRSTVTSALKSLRSLGAVEYTPYGPVHLTELGSSLAGRIFHRHSIFKAFLSSILHIDDGEADKAACGLEHAVPDHIIRKLGCFILYMESQGLPDSRWEEAYERDRDTILSAMRSTSPCGEKQDR